MKVTIDLAEILGEERTSDLRSYVEELLRCSFRLRMLIPEDVRGGVTLENYLLTDRPELQEEVKVCLQTMAEERREIVDVFSDAAEEIVALIARTVIMNLYPYNSELVSLGLPEWEERLREILRV
jgi:hypothetical protein